MEGDFAASRRPASLRLSLCCELAQVRPAVARVHSFLAGQGWREEELLSLDLALVEACNNAIKYAGGAARSRPIDVEAVCDGNQVEFRVHDHTPGFDWPEKIELPTPESESGRGLYLITSLMEHAGYFRGGDGNILVLRKGRSAASRRAAGESAALPEDSSKLAETERVIKELVEELTSCYETLSAIFRYSNEEGDHGSLKVFAQRLVGDLLQIIPADWYVLRLAPAGESRLVVFVASEAALELESFEFPASGEPVGGVEMEVAVNRKRIWFEPKQSDLTAAGSLQRTKPDSVGLVTPLLRGEQLIGTLALGRRRAGNAVHGQAVFTPSQTNVIKMFADFLAIQIANARFREEQVNRRLVSHELEIANGIQRSLLPETLPQLAGFSLAGFCRSAHAVGGDFYDVLRVNGDAHLLVVADVMGKGIPGAMFAVILRSLLRASPELTDQPAALLTRVNRLLFPELSGVDMFITAQLAYVNARERRIITASAGHCPLAVADAREVRMFSPEGMPLGILPDATFLDETVELPEDCRVLLYTDGVTDAMNARREPFGQERLMNWLRRTTASPRTAEQLKEELAQALNAHQLDAGLADDQTFLIMAERCG